MKATIYIEGVIGEETTLLDVIRQFKSFEDVTEVEVVINSVGGDVDEGRAIYSYLKGLGEGMIVTTVAKKAYSIAAQIFAAGTIRQAEAGDDKVMIHCPWIAAEGNADELEWYAEALRGLEKEFVGFYSTLLDIDKDAVQELLNAETYMSGQEAVDIGLATELKEMKLKAVALVKEKKSKTKSKKKMSDKKEAKSLIHAFAKLLGVDLAAKAELKVQDATGEEIVFPDLDEGDTPAIGDSATLGGSAIADGEYIIPSLADAIYVFAGGVVTEIKEAIEEKEEMEEESNASAKAKGKPKAKNMLRPTFKAEEIQEICTWTVYAENDSFEVGTQVTYFDEWDEQSRSVGAGEYQLKDGRRIVTDATGTVVTIKENTPSGEPSIDAEAMAKEIESRIEAKFAAKLKEKEEEVAKLKAMASPELNPKPQANDDKGSEKESRLERRVKGAMNARKK